MRYWVILLVGMMGGVEATNLIKNAATKFVSFVGKAKTPQERLKTKIDEITELELKLEKIFIEYSKTKHPIKQNPSIVDIQQRRQDIDTQVNLIKSTLQLTQEKLLEIIDTYIIYDKNQSRIKINTKKLDNLKIKLDTPKDPTWFPLNNLHLVDILEYTLNEILNPTPSAQSPHRHSHPQ